MMKIQFRCPVEGCRQKLWGSSQLAGKVVKCPACGRLIRIPPLPAPGAKAPTPPPSSAAQEDPGRTPSRPITVQGPSYLNGSPNNDLTGTTVSHFEILEKLGEGAMGTVYKAVNKNLNRTIALKIMSHAAKGHEINSFRRFMREAQLAAQLDHPNVVTIHSIGEEAGFCFIEMRYVDGRTLHEVIQQGPLGVGRATQIILEAAYGLAAAHEKGIIHRDIKPANIMIDKEGRVLVADFGLARIEESFTELTSDGQIMGTPHYISPEQCRGDRADLRSDIYSLGATYFHALTGQTPFTGETLMAVMYCHTHEPLRNIRTVKHEVPTDVAAIVNKMMAKEPQKRYQSCGELVSDLRGSLARHAHAKSGSQPPKPRMLWRYVAIVAVTSIIALGAGFSLAKILKKLRPHPRPAAKQELAPR